MIVSVKPDILEGYETAERGNRALFARLEALADMKYTYVISCQSFTLFSR